MLAYFIAIFVCFRKFGGNLQGINLDLGELKIFSRFLVITKELKNIHKKRVFGAVTQMDFERFFLTMKKTAKKILVF